MQRKTSGFFLISVYLIFSVLVLLLISFVSRSVGNIDLASRQNNSIQALYLAESGIDDAIVWMRNQAILSLPYNSGNVALGAGSFNFAISSPSACVYEVVSTAAVDNISKTIVATFTDDHYARYAYFSDSEQYWIWNVWFVDWDVLKGPVQSNGRFNIKGNPTFEGVVSSASDVIRFYNNGSYLDTSATSNPPYDQPDFQQGVTLGADVMPLPSTALDLRNAANSSGLFLTGNSTVVFNSDGTINVTNAAKGWSNFNTAIPANGAVFVDNGDLNISGTVNGALSVGASQNIIVTDNVVYNDDPRVNPASTDTLGVIAEENVIISQSAPYDLEIDASIMALDTSFTVQNWWQGPAKGTLTVYGGIIQEERGPVGTFSGSTKLSGYSKDYEYDSRLADNPPPFNPTTGDYVMSSWREE